MSESEDDLPDVRIDFNQADVKEVWFAGDSTVYNVSTITHNGNWQYNFQVRMQMLGEAAVLQDAIRVYRSYPCAG